MLRISRNRFGLRGCFDYRFGKTGMDVLPIDLAKSIFFLYLQEILKKNYWSINLPISTYVLYLLQLKDKVAFFALRSDGCSDYRFLDVLTIV